MNENPYKDLVTSNQFTNFRSNDDQNQNMVGL